MSKKTAKIDVKDIAQESIRKTGGVLRGFRDFALRGNAMELAIGVVIGGAFTALVNSLVNSIVNPFIAAIFGGTNMDGIWILDLHGSQVRFGTFFSAVINFLIVAAALYFFIILPLNKLIAFMKKDDATPEENTDDTPQTQEELLAAILKTLEGQRAGKAIK